MSILVSGLVINNEPVDIIERCLRSIVSISNQIITIISSKREKDKKLTALLKKYNVEVTEYADLSGTVVEEWRNKFLEFGEFHQFKWILIIDPDESLMPDALKFLDKNLKGVNDPEVAGFAFPRINHEWNENMTEVIYYSGYPDPQIRVVRPFLRYSGKIHVQIDIPQGYHLIMANGHIMHDKSYESRTERDRKTKLYLKKLEGEQAHG